MISMEWVHGAVALNAESVAKLGKPSEIIEKTLKEIGPRLEEHEEPYSEDPDWEEIVIAELQERLPDTDIKTCEDFRHLNVTCCDTCHTFLPALRDEAG